MADQYATETSDEFSSRLATVVSHGYTSLSIAFGVQSGLFDTLVEHHQTPKTSQELADSAGMKERYVREWLGIMIHAHIINIDPATERYYLPPHRVPSFKKGAMSGLTAMFSKGVPFLCEVFNDMLEAVKRDGPLGLPSSKCGTFREFEEDWGAVWYDTYLCQEFVPSMPSLCQGLETGIRMLDVGCGRGAATRCMAQQYPNSKFIGLDISEENIKIAKERAKSKNLTNVEYLCVDATSMPPEWTATFDYVFIFNVVHDVPRPDKVLEEVKRVIKPDGTMSVLEPDMHTKQADNFSLPYATDVYTISLFHCLPISYYYPGSMGLGAAWGRDRATKFLQECGFTVQAITKPPNSLEFHMFCTLSSK